MKRNTGLTLSVMMGALALAGSAFAAPGAGLSAGALSLDATVPGGVDIEDVTVGATNRASVNDRATVSGSVTSTGTQQTVVGNDATVLGDVVSASNVRVWHRAHVSGTAASEGNVHVESSATVGTVLSSQVFGADEITTLDFDVPAASAGTLLLNPDSAGTWAADRYDNVTVNSRATLSISAGTYFVDRLTIEPQARIVLDDSAGPIILVVGKSLIMRGTWVDDTDDGLAPALLVAYDGTQAVSVDTAFDGFIAAPAATVRLSGNDLVHRGAFFGKNVEVTPGNVVEHRSFVSCDFVDSSDCLGDCACLTPNSFFEAIVTGAVVVDPGANGFCANSSSTSIAFINTAGIAAGGEAGGSGSGNWACESNAGYPGDVGFVTGLTSDEAMHCADLVRDALIDGGVNPATECQPW